jgi:hypothetical protein
MRDAIAFMLVWLVIGLIKFYPKEWM